ncbi:MAG: hypothetical protein ABIR70_07970 [Bryobacteraceae bacterium]
MKNTLVALLVMIAPVFAGKRITAETVDLATNKVTPRAILLDADRLKVDNGDTVVMFLSKGGARVVMLDKVRNTYRVMDQATMDALGAQMAGMSSQMEAAMKNMPPAARAQMEAALKGKLGQTQVASPVGTTYTAKGAGTANGFKCTNYDGAQNGTKISEICAASMGDLKLGPADFAVMEKMREYLAGMMKALQSGPLGGLVSTSGTGLTEQGINGLPVQTVHFVNGKATTRDSVKSVAEASLTDADFSTGTATLAEMPGIGAAKGKGRAK